MRNKGQVSVEFFLLFIIVIAFFSIFMFVLIEIQRQTTYISNYNSALSVAQEVGNAVNSVVANQINLSVKIPYGYEITTQPGAVIATQYQSNVSSSWPISHVITNLNITPNSTTIIISMQDSIVYLNG